MKYHIVLKSLIIELLLKSECAVGIVKLTVKLAMYRCFLLQFAEKGKITSVHSKSLYTLTYRDIYSDCFVPVTDDL